MVCKAVQAETRTPWQQNGIIKAEPAPSPRFTRVDWSEYVRGSKMTMPGAKGSHSLLGQ